MNNAPESLPVAAAVPFPSATVNAVAQPPASSGTQENAMSTSQRNKHLALQALEGLMVKKDVSTVERYFAEPYLQHNPAVPSGLQALRRIVEGLGSNPQFRYERFRVVAEGDLVAVHGRYTGWGPEPLIAVDLFRFSDGRIVEHWDGMQVEAGPNPSGHSMVDGPTEPRALERTEAHRQLVAEFVNAVLVGGQFHRLPEFINAHSYTQHNPLVADGLSGLGAFVQQLQQQGISFRYTRVHRVVAEGDFVLTQSEGEFGGKPQAFYDMFRVEDGKIVEHWDVIQPVPETTASGLGLF